MEMQMASPIAPPTELPTMIAIDGFLEVLPVEVDGGGDVTF
jgi:hypothetical protein